MIRFIHISDTHIGPDPAFLLQGVNTFHSFQSVIQAIQNLPFKPEFIIHTGDVVADPDPKSYELYAQMVKEVQIPMYYVSGNHDDSQMILSGLQIGERIQLMQDKLVYSFKVSGNSFLVVDARGPREIDPHGTISEAQMDVIQSQLTNTHSLITIFVHFPLLAMDCNWVDKKMLLLEGEKLHALFVEHREQILGVFHGHIHRGTINVQDGIRYQSLEVRRFNLALCLIKKPPHLKIMGKGILIS